MRHAATRMNERDISRNEVKFTLQQGIVIQNYPTDRPLPSYLLLAFPNGQPIHLLVGYDASQHYCALITVYEPDPAEWSVDFTRKTSRS